MTSLTGTYHDRTKRSYLTMNAFNDDMFTYTTSVDPNTFITSGALSAVTGATASNCPKARFLYENGKKLYPGANPGITTYMVGVFDPVSFLSGFIDPNSEAFTLMNTDKPVDMANSSNVFGTNPNGSTSDLALPVFTRGDVLALGNLDICGNQYLAGSQYVVGNIDVSGTATITGATTITNGALTIADGKLILDAVGANAIVGTATLNGAVGGGVVTVTTSACTIASKIFLSYVSIGGATEYGTIRATAAAGSFVITGAASETSTVNWLIIN